LLHNSTSSSNRSVDMAVSISCQMWLCLPSASVTFCIRGAICFKNFINFIPLLFGDSFYETLISFICQQTVLSISASTDTSAWTIKPAKSSPKWHIICRWNVEPYALLSSPVTKNTMTQNFASLRAIKKSDLWSTLWIKKTPPPFYIMNNSEKNEPILISFGTRNPLEISHQRIIISPTSPE